MAPQLPTLKQCMADVSAGIYKPSNASKIASGGSLPPKLDSTSGQPVTIIVQDTPIIKSDTVISPPKKSDSDESEDGGATPTTESTETPKTDGEEEKAETATAQISAQSSMLLTDTMTGE